MTPADAIASAQEAVKVGLEETSTYSPADVSRSADGRWTVSLARTDEAGRIVDRLSLVTVTLDDAGKVVEVSCGSLRPEPDGRPRWKKKRWWAVGAFLLSLPVLIALSEGPAEYYFLRGRIDLDTLNRLNDRLHRPFHRVLPGKWYRRNGYVRWWRDLAERHGRVYRPQF